MNLTPHITVAIKRHAFDLEGIGETVLASALVEWAKLLPKSVSFTNLVQSEPSPKAHNPDGLTPEQVGISDGWRLLDEDEVGEQFSKTTGLISSYLKHGRWGSENYSGGATNLTYRTKLCRSVLAAARSATGEPSTK